MKKLLSCLALSLFACVLLLSPVQARVVVQDSKNELYEKFHKNTTGDSNMQRIAYDAGKEYLKKYPNDTDAKAKEIRDWIARFEANLPVEVQVKVFKERNYPGAFELGKQLLANDPENLKILIALGYAGMLASASGNSDFLADSMTYGKKAIQLLQAGKAPAEWRPFSGKDETLSWLNYSLGLMAYRTMPQDSIGYLMQAAQYEAPPKKDPLLYFYLATLYNQEYQKQRDAYTAKYSGKQETPESKAEFEKVNALLDPVIDAFARAVAYADADPQAQARFQQQKADWMSKLTERYKFRHNDSDAGLKELIDTVRTKPLPGQQGLTPVSMP
ncbi:MAG: hypothetical protein JOZ52_01495 [Acidobacteria bacterium]|nr:hypothetical protein [Acidobacteriota bacterium]